MLPVEVGARADEAGGGTPPGALAREIALLVEARGLGRSVAPGLQRVERRIDLAFRERVERRAGPALEAVGELPADLLADRAPRLLADPRRLQIAGNVLLAPLLDEGFLLLAPGRDRANGFNRAARELEACRNRIHQATSPICASDCRLGRTRPGASRS